MRWCYYNGDTMWECGIAGYIETIRSLVIERMNNVSTKRIQPARGWCATVPQSGGLFGGTQCKLYPTTPPLRRPGLPVFWGSQPCVPAAWLAERLLLAGDIESNPGTHPHTTDHLFNCTHLYTSSNILDLWRVAPLLVRWKRRLAGLL